jgi:solute carrier family 30 (zinc transporter), member 1
LDARFAQFAKRSSTNNTFGWVRMETLGALVNAVFLIALCFSIIIDAITRMIKVEGEHLFPCMISVVGHACITSALVA